MKIDPSHDVLLLSIQEMHADKIFKGAKKYELRRKLPQKPFSRVYLYQTGGTGVVGCFETGPVLRAETKILWKKVGEKATSKERFNRYFEGTHTGYAITIKRAVRFSTPIFPLVIKRNAPFFSAPMSYLVVRPGTDLFKLLERRRKEESGPLHVKLRRIRSSEHSKYTKLITPLISSRYDEITDKFASNILSIHRKGFDVNGILTKKKQVLVITFNNKLIGFTTVTFKLGGAMKTGPTVLFPKFRSRGYGLGLRRALLSYAQKHRVRRIYCTCPDNDNKLIFHFIRAGFSIEAHLISHYAQSNGELVFGMLLKTEVEQIKSQISRISRSTSLVKLDECNKDRLADLLRAGFSANWTKITKKAAHQLAEKARTSSFVDYEDKPVNLVASGSFDDFLSFGLLIHKRGGASKLLLYTKTNHRTSIRLLLTEIALLAQRMGRKKLYCLHPWNDFFLVHELKLFGFQSEGILREPYIPGKDLLILSKPVSYLAEAEVATSRR